MTEPFRGRLVSIKADGNDGSIIPLRKDISYKIGYTSNCHIQLKSQSDKSREPLGSIGYEANKGIVLNSVTSNDIKVNNENIHPEQPRHLQNSDVIQIGDKKIRLEIAPVVPELAEEEEEEKSFMIDNSKLVEKSLLTVEETKECVEEEDHAQSNEGVTLAEDAQAAERVKSMVAQPRIGTPNTPASTNKRNESILYSLSKSDRSYGFIQNGPKRIRVDLGSPYPIEDYAAEIRASENSNAVPFEEIATNVELPVSKEVVESSPAEANLNNVSLGVDPPSEIFENLPIDPSLDENVLGEVGEENIPTQEIVSAPVNEPSIATVLQESRMEENLEPDTSVSMPLEVSDMSVNITQNEPEVPQEMVNDPKVDVQLPEMANDPKIDVQLQEVKNEPGLMTPAKTDTLISNPTPKFSDDSVKEVFSMFDSQLFDESVINALEDKGDANGEFLPESTDPQQAKDEINSGDEVNEILTQDVLEEVEEVTQSLNNQIEVAQSSINPVLEEVEKVFDANSTLVVPLVVRQNEISLCETPRRVINDLLDVVSTSGQAESESLVHILPPGQLEVEPIDTSFPQEDKDQEDLNSNQVANQAIAFGPACNVDLTENAKLVDQGEEKEMTALAHEKEERKPIADEIEQEETENISNEKLEDNKETIPEKMCDESEPIANGKCEDARTQESSEDIKTLDEETCEDTKTSGDEINETSKIPEQVVEMPEELSNISNKEAVETVESPQKLYKEDVEKSPSTTDNIVSNENVLITVESSESLNEAQDDACDGTKGDLVDSNEKEVDNENFVDVKQEPNSSICQEHPVDNVQVESEAGIVKPENELDNPSVTAVPTPVVAPTPKKPIVEIQEDVKEEESSDIKETSNPQENVIPTPPRTRRKARANTKVEIEVAAVKPVKKTRGRSVVQEEKKVEEVKPKTRKGKVSRKAEDLEVVEEKTENVVEKRSTRSKKNTSSEEPETKVAKKSKKVNADPPTKPVRSTRGKTQAVEVQPADVKHKATRTKVLEEVEAPVSKKQTKKAKVSAASTAKSKELETPTETEVLPAAKSKAKKTVRIQEPEVSPSPAPPSKAKKTSKKAKIDPPTIEAPPARVTRSLRSRK